MYLSLKEQECTKQIEKISVFTLHVFRGMYLHFTTAGGVTLELGDRKCKQRARSKCRFSFAVSFDWRFIFDFCYKVTRRTLLITNS